MSKPKDRREGHEHETGAPKRRSMAELNQSVSSFVAALRQQYPQLPQGLHGPSPDEIDQEASKLTLTDEEYGQLFEEGIRKALSTVTVIVDRDNSLVDWDAIRESEIALSREAGEGDEDDELGGDEEDNKKNEATPFPEFIDNTDLMRAHAPDLEITSFQVSRRALTERLSDCPDVVVNSANNLAMASAPCRFSNTIASVGAALGHIEHRRPGAAMRPFRIALCAPDGTQFVVERDTSGRIVLLAPEEEGSIASEIETQWTMEPVAGPEMAGEQLLLPYRARLEWAEDGVGE